jgi:dynamin family protein
MSYSLSPRSPTSAGLARWQDRHVASNGRMLRELAGIIHPTRTPGPPLRVGLLGAFSSGKSTLICSLLGEKVAEAHALPTTHCLTRFVYAPAPRISISRPTDGMEAQIGWALTEADLMRRWYKREPLASLLPPADTLGGTEVTIGHPHPLLAEGIVLIDTPGHDAPDEADGATARGALDGVDAVLYLCRHPHILGEADLLIISQIVAKRLPCALVVTDLGYRWQDADWLSTTRAHVDEVCTRWKLARPLEVLWGPDRLQRDGSLPPDSLNRQDGIIGTLTTWKRRAAAK